MEAVALLARARQAGLVVLRDGTRLVVRGPKRLADLALELLDRKTEVLGALDADPGLPPPSPSPPADPYGAAIPTAACYCCGAVAWHRAGSGWACARCHPPPGDPPAVTDADLDTTLLAIAEHAGFLMLALSPGVTVLPGPDAWRRFAVLTTSQSLRARALAALCGQEPGKEG
jgi:hypothetical protein